MATLNRHTFLFSFLASHDAHIKPSQNLTQFLLSGQPPERVTTNKSQYAYFDPRSGYLSEPEGGLTRLTSSTWSDAYDSDVTTGPRRRTASVQEDRRMNETTTTYMSNNKFVYFSNITLLLKRPPRTYMPNNKFVCFSTK